MTPPGRPVYSLALRETYAQLGARLIERSGWLIPADFGDQAREYRAMREGAALFDRSHRSRFLVTGPDALDVLRAVFAGHLEDLDEGRSRRAAVVDEQGIVRDLALISRTAGIAYLVSGEPAQRMGTLDRLRSATRADYDARVDDRTETTCLLALAGPDAARIAAEHLAEGLPARLQTLQCSAFEFHGFRALATRASDVGEDGFELMLAPAVAHHITETVAGAGAVVAGDAAFEAGRVEACVPAWDPDLSPGLTPAEADLDVLLDIDGGAAGRILAGVLLDSEVPIAVGQPVIAGGRVAGELRSCVRSPALGVTIGLAIIDTAHALPASDLSVAGVRASVVAKPFLRRRRQT